jgi:hypothetical protein
MIKGTRVVDEIIVQLLEVWTNVIGERVKYSRKFKNSKKSEAPQEPGITTGHLISFTIACLSVVKGELNLKFTLEPNAIGQRIERLRQEHRELTCWICEGLRDQPDGISAVELADRALTDKGLHGPSVRATFVSRLLLLLGNMHLRGQVERIDSGQGVRCWLATA